MDTTKQKHIADAVFEGVRHHLFMEYNMTDEPISDHDYWTVGQLSLCILGAFGVGDDWDGKEIRGFLTDCGIPEEIANKMVQDDDPWGIY